MDVDIRAFEHAMASLIPNLRAGTVDSIATSLRQVYYLLTTNMDGSGKAHIPEEKWIQPEPDLSRSGRDNDTDDQRAKVVEAKQGLPILVNLLQSSTAPVMLNNACAVIAVLSRAMQKTGIKGEFARLGVTPSLIQLLGCAHQGIQFWAAVALRNLARNDNTKGLLASQGVIPPLVKLLRSDNKSVQAAALCCIVNVSNNDDNEKKIAHENAIPLIVQLMKSNDEIVMNNAIWALNNLSFKDENKAQVADEGGIELLIHHIKTSTRDETREYSAYVLWNLTFKNDQNKVRICNNGGIAALSTLLEAEATSLRQSGLGALNNITSRMHLIDFARFEEELNVEALVNLLSLDDVNIQKHTTSVLRNLISSKHGCRLLVFKNAVPILVRLIVKNVPTDSSGEARSSRVRLQGITESSTLESESDSTASNPVTILKILMQRMDSVKFGGEQVSSSPMYSSELVNSERFHDIRLIVEGKPIYAHKAVLFSRSEYWHALFNSRMTDSDQPELVINTNASYTTYLEVVKFIYTDACSITSDNVVALLELADLYNFPRLLGLCEKFLSDVADGDNFDQLLEICDSFDLRQLRATLTRWVLQHRPSLSDITEEQLRMLTFKRHTAPAH